MYNHVRRDHAARLEADDGRVDVEKHRSGGGDQRDRLVLALDRPDRHDLGNRIDCLLPLVEKGREVTPRRFSRAGSAR